MLDSFPLPCPSDEKYTLGTENRGKGQILLCGDKCNELRRNESQSYVKEYIYG